jgi:hypothetical protein
MKKILIGFLALSMLTIFSCKKAAVVNGGSFTFKGTTYNVTSAIGNTTADNSLVCINSGNNTYNECQFIFYSSIVGGAQVAPYPTAGTYTVVTGAPDTTGTQVSINLVLTTGATYNAINYAVDPAANVHATVTVSNGELHISLPAVNMINIHDTTGTDHGTLTATVMQTQATE